jgi:hypothetical protein
VISVDYTQRVTEPASLRLARNNGWDEASSWTGMSNETFDGRHVRALKLKPLEV